MEIMDNIVRMIEMDESKVVTSVDKSTETSKKVKLIIDKLIDEETILLVTQDAQTKDGRYLSLEGGVSVSNAAAGLKGSGAPVYE